MELKLVILEEKLAESAQKARWTLDATPAGRAATTSDVADKK